MTGRLGLDPVPARRKEAARVRVLAADVGGTNSRLALVETEEFEIVEERAYSSRDHDGLAAVVERFQDEGPGGELAAACFGVAGPVHGGRAELTNLPWAVDAGDLRDRLGIPIAVINDLEAAAWSLEILRPQDQEVIREGIGSKARGNRALISPGTGLGEAGLFWDGSEHRPFATEGGHADFAASEELEWELREELAERHGRVSWERVVSGPGLVAIHRFLASRRGARGDCPAEGLDERDESVGPAITRGAQSGLCEICRESLDLFARLLGAETGNLALKLFATGGVWIGGGIVPSIAADLREGRFLEGFLGKGRMRDLVERIPVVAIVDEKAGLRGAGRVAARLAMKGRRQR